MVRVGSPFSALASLNASTAFVAPPPSSTSALAVGFFFWNAISIFLIGFVVELVVDLFEQRLDLAHLVVVPQAVFLLPQFEKSLRLFRQGYSRFDRGVLLRRRRLPSP
jgi:hypothetical protein